MRPRIILDGSFDSLTVAEQERFFQLSRDHDVFYRNHGELVQILDLTTDTKEVQGAEQGSLQG